MAAEPKKARARRAPVKPRPVILLFRGDNIEIVSVTRDAFAVIEALQGDPTLKHVKLDLPTQRRGPAAVQAAA